MKYLKLFERLEEEVWHIGPTGSIETSYTNKHDKLVTYNTPDYYDINLFLEWMHDMHISFSIHNNPRGHNFKSDAKYPCGVKFSNFTVKNFCTWTQYTIGEGHNLTDAITDFMNIVKGKTIVADGGNPNYKTGKKIQVPEDFELWCTAKKFNL